MTRYIICYLLFLFSAFYASSSKAQECEQTTEGTDFWLGFMHHTEPGWPAELVLFITSRNTTSGEIIVGDEAPIPFNVTANTSIRIDLDRTTAENIESQQIVRKSIHVTSNDPISLYALNQKDFSSDATVIYPTQALGTSYYALSIDPPTAGNGIYRSEFLIVATEDNTSIAITPSQETLEGDPAGTTFNITLDAGDSYQVQAAASTGAGAAGDMSGSQITADKRVAVFSGNHRTRIPADLCCYDHVYYQMTPVNALGRNYITTPLRYYDDATDTTPLRSYDVFRVMAVRDNTDVDISGTLISLNQGEVYEFTTQGNNIPQIISASEPVLVGQFSAGRDIDGIEDADPFLMIVNPNEQIINEITFDAFDINGISAYLVNVLALTSEVNGITLDGAPVDPADFEVVPGTNYSYGKLSVDPGSHTLAGAPGAIGFTVYVYGYGAAKAFGYSAGGSLTPFLDLGEDKQVCASGSLAVTLDAGNFSDYLWNTGETTQTITATEPGTYSVVATNEFGCTASDEVVISQNEIPEAEVKVNGSPVPDDTARVCGLVNQVEFDADMNSHDADFGYAWSSGQTTASFTTSVSSDSTWYSIEVTDPDNRSDCQDVGRDSAFIVFYPDPVAEIALDNGATPSTTQFYCRSQGDQQLFADSTLNPDYFEYRWESPDGDILGTGSQFTANSQEDSSTYILITSNPLTQTDCEVSDTLSMVFLPDLEIQYESTPAPDTVYLCENATAEELSIGYPDGGEDLDLALSWHLLSTGATISTEETANLPPDITSGTEPIELRYNHSSGLLGCERRDTLTFIFISRESASIVYNGTQPDSLAFCEYELPIELTYTTTVPQNEVSWQQIDGGGNLTNIPGTIDFLDTVSVGGFVGDKDVVLAFRELISPAQCVAYDTLRLRSNPTPETGLPDTLFVCDSVGTFSAAANGNEFEYLWQFPDGSSDTLRSFTPPLQGTYTLLVTNTQTGCIARDTAYAAFEQNPDIGITYDSLRPICYYNRVRLSVVPDSAQLPFLSYRWGNNQTLPSIFAADTGTVSYNLTATNTRTGCQTTVSRSVRFSPYPALNPPPVSGFCIDGDTTGFFLPDNPNLDYIWTYPDGTTDSSRLILADQAGTYQIYANNTRTGCDTSKTMEVIIENPPLLDLAERTEICRADSLATLVAQDLTHGQFIRYQWQALPGGRVLGESGTLLTDTAGVFAVTVTDTITGCSIRDTGRVIIHPNPDFAISGHDSAVCARADTLRLDRTNIRGFEIVWEGPGNPTPINGGTALIVRQTGDYRVSVTDPATGCQTTKTQFVSINPLPVLPEMPLPESLRICPQDSSVLSAFHPEHTPSTRYRWRALSRDSVVSNTAFWNVQGMIPVPANPQAYEIEIKDTLSGCARRDTTEITFLPQSDARISQSASVLCLGETALLQAEGGTRYQWNTGETSTQITVRPERTGIQTYVLTAFLGQQCAPTSDTVTLEVNGVPTANLRADTLRACAGDSLFLDGQHPDDPLGTTYRWTSLDENTLLSEDSAFFIRRDAATQLSIELQKRVPTSACVTRDTFRLVFGAPSAVRIAPDSASICLGETLRLEATGGTDFRWDDEQTSATINWTPERTGLQRRIVFARNAGCGQTSDTVWVQVSPVPTARIEALSPTSICAGDSVLLRATGGESYRWQRDDALNGDTLALRPVASGWVRLEATRGAGCTVTDSVWVEVEPGLGNYPTVFESCDETSMTIGKELSVPARYRWTSLELETPTIEVRRSGTYPIEITIGACRYTREVRADFRPVPELILPPDTSLCFDSVAFGSYPNLQARIAKPDSAATYRFLWENEAGNAVSSGAAFAVPEAGRYTVRVAAEYETVRCTDTGTVRIASYCRPQVYIPEGFTPDGDGLNERFEVFGGDYVRNFEMSVYDRWGRLLYRLENASGLNIPDEAWWDGNNSSGQPVPSGTYTWTIHYEVRGSGEAQRVRHSGVVQILR